MYQDALNGLLAKVKFYHALTLSRNRYNMAIKAAGRPEMFTPEHGVEKESIGWFSNECGNSIYLHYLMTPNGVNYV